MRLLVIGASTEPVCGVRDCARTLEPALVAAGADVATVWWERGGGETAKAFGGRAAAGAQAHRADAILWHYSVFAYGSRGIPHDVPGLARSLSRWPLVGLLHELMGGSEGRGLRGRSQVAAQRIVLRRLCRSLAAAVVTTDERLDLLPDRLPAVAIPVPSNIEPLVAPLHAPRAAPHVGVFGFRSDLVATDIVVAGVASVDGASLVLLGAPGADSPAGARWRDAAATAGCQIEFTGILEPGVLSQRLSSLDAIVFPDPSGPTARRGTLAAALAHGRPVIGFAGPRRWRSLEEAGAARLVPLDAERLTAELRRLAADPAASASQGTAGRAFYERTMSPGVVATQLLSHIASAGAGR